MVPTWWIGCVVGISWWGENYQTDIPVVALPIANDGTMFAPWASEDESRDAEQPPDCKWWNGTYYYDLDLCSHMSVTRMPAHYAQRAVERATRCAVHGATDCVLSGEIGFNIPAAFVWDEGHGMRMIVAPKLLEAENVQRKTVRLQDPNGEHPNQLFEFKSVVRAEYLRAAGRTMETIELRGNDAYCLQTLRRAVVPTCWDALD